jgi:hypothetical protein
MSTEPPEPGAAGRRRLVWSLVGAASPDRGVEGLVAWLQRVCRASAAALPVQGVAVHLMSTGADAVAASSDDETRALADLQFAANEGPAHSAFSTRRPVLVPDLADAVSRWPGFVSLAIERGARSVFAFPMQEGAAGFGVLEAYADRAGPLDADALALAGAFCTAATELVMDGGVVTAGGELDPGLAAPFGDRDRIHQAQGMVMVDLGVSLPEALTRMRARAFALNLTMIELARKVIAGTLTAGDWTDGDT